MNKYAELLDRAAEEIDTLYSNLYPEDYIEPIYHELRQAAYDLRNARPTAWETTSGDFVRNDGQKYNEHWEPLYRHPAPVVPQLAKHQPCGCVICTCADDVQCQGCGATHCGTHPVGEFSAPVFETAPENEQLRTALTAALNWYERQAQSAGDFMMVERMKKALGI